MTHNAEKYVLPGGATRSEKAPPFHLVPRAGFRRTALRFGLGAEKHGEWNWLSSLNATEHAAAAFANEAYNHMLEHTLKMAQDVDPQDDHLGAIGWAQSVLAYIEERFGCRWTELGLPKADVTTHGDEKAKSVRTANRWEARLGRSNLSV